MSTESYPAMLQSLNADLDRLRTDAADPMRAFSALASAALKPGSLDVRTKELIATAIAVAIRCYGCIGFHVKAAIKAGASREEILETLSMAIYMGAGPSMIYAAEALRAFDELSTPQEAEA